MARKPEAVFRSAVNKLILPPVHKQAMSPEFSNGTPDHWYDYHRDLWVEYKYTPIIPPLLQLVDPKKKPSLSILQQTWLERAYNNGRNVAVIVGSPKGGIILTSPARWLVPIPRDEFLADLFTKQEIADWITRYVSRSG